jgi:hypothetical protein
MAVVDVNDAPGEGCKCDKNQMPTIVFIINLIGCVLIGLVAVLDLITFTGIPSVILDLYLVVLSFLALSAEARLFRPLRSIIYNWIKFVYFLTSYTGRGFFYVFLGSVTINESALSYIGGGFAIFAGLFMMIVNCRFKLPLYLDWQVVKEEAAAKARKSAEQAFRTPGAASTPTPQGHDAGHYSPPGGHAI